MRLLTAVPTLFAGVLGIPAFVQDGTRADASLSAALSSTVSALEYLAGVRSEIEAGERGAIRRVLSATEPVDLTVPPEARESRLVQLREEVASLQAELDWIETTESPGESWTGLDDPTYQSSATLPAPPPGGTVTTGLDDGMRKRLASKPKPAENATSEAPPEVRPEARRSFEGAGYVADALRLGRSLYRAGHYERAIATLAELDGAPEAVYWSARAQEKLGNFDEALSGYESVAADPEAQELAQQAETDASFLKWRQRFVQPLEERR